jgi:carbon-monoxide dehydrogenase small subunit
MTAYAFLKETPAPTEAQVKEAIAGNICRCTGYLPIIQAILEAAPVMSVISQKTPTGS